jgi:hypothetical protein
MEPGCIVLVVVLARCFALALICFDLLHRLEMYRICRTMGFVMVAKVMTQQYGNHFPTVSRLCRPSRTELELFFFDRELTL